MGGFFFAFNFLKMKKKRIAIQGVKGAFHEEAALKVFGEEIEIVPCMNFKELTEKVKNREVDFAVMAIENTISGTILSNLELIHQQELKIVGETYLRIVQNLGVVQDATLATLREVRSHYMALNQCRDYFQTEPQIQLVDSADTALSLKEVAEAGSVEFGGIGSKLAIEHYGLKLLAEGIETNKKNYTRFAVLSNELLVNQNAIKISLSMILSHEPGALSKVLSLLHLLNVNLTKIESSPILGEPFHYRFYLDILLGENVSYQTTIEALKPLTEELQILGRYIPGKNLK